MTQRELITGSSGQDGQYMVREAIRTGADVHVLVHPSAVDHVAIDGVTTHRGDLTDFKRVEAIINSVSPDVIYNLAGLSSVADAWNRPTDYMMVNAAAAINIMDVASSTIGSNGNQTVVVQASSAEIFAGAAASPQNETTDRVPINPYGVSKLAAHQFAALQRQRGFAVSSMILYNHESPLRPPRFVSRKITRGVAAIKLGKASDLTLGNLSARRDWGWAPDYVAAMRLAANPLKADEYVIATGVGRTVEEFCATCFRLAGIEDWERYIRISDNLIRTGDAVNLIGDASKAHTVLNWAPRVSFEEIVERMLLSDLARI